MRGSRPHTRCCGQATIPFSRGNDTCSSVNHTEEPQRRQPLGQAALGATSGGPPQRSGVEQRQLPQTTDSVPSGQCVLRHRYELRNPGLPETGAHTRGGRQIARRPFGRTVCGRRERHALPVGCIGRLQPVARPRAYRARLARHQFRDTRGHGTTCMAKFWKEQLQEFVATAPRRPFMPGPQSAMHESKAA